ncbi:MAG: stage V sporulation protein AE [Clostridia bacterium]|jgi:stage V sporulation protein AE|nr:stage V sporulation protein AE [Clostridia bacterium]MBR2645555.1 stage V sporulation protein AE [Clostridia bacterium]
MQYLWSFLVGGAICTVGQLLLSFTRLTSARILVLFVVSGVVLGGLGIYQPLVDFAGAGASVPLLGFGNALAKGAIEGAKAHGVLGAFSGGISATASGISAAVLFGWLAALIFRPRSK